MTSERATVTMSELRQRRAVCKRRWRDRGFGLLGFGFGLLCIGDFFFFEINTKTRLYWSLFCFCSWTDCIRVWFMISLPATWPWRGFDFWFSVFFFFFFLESVGYLCNLLGSPWAWLYYNFFFFQILVQIFFGLFFFFLAWK